MPIKMPAAPKCLLLTAALIMTTAAVGGCDAGNDDAASARAPLTEPVEAAQPAGSEVAANDLQVGECMTDSGTAASPHIQVLPCTQPHSFEVFATTELPQGEYPGIGEADAQAQEFCRTEFFDFVGMDYDVSALDLQYFYPVEEEWNDDGGRSVVCLVGKTAGDPHIGTLRDSRR